MKRKLGMGIWIMVASVCLAGCGDLEDALMKELENAVAGELEGYVEEELAGITTEEEMNDSESDTDLMDEETAENTQPEEAQGGQGTAHKEVDGVQTAKVDAVTESSSASSYNYGINAVDGDAGTCWVTREGDSDGAWIQIYFTEPFTITEVLVEHGYLEEYDSYGKIQSMDLTFDDGSSTTIGCKMEDMDTFSQEIIPVTTSSVMIDITSVYEGAYADNLVIRELTFLSNPNGLLAAPNDSTSNQSTNGSDYVKDGWTWEATGYDAQDIDNEKFVVGKWESDDKNTILYVDFPSSPDYLEYGLYHNGTIVEYEAEMNWVESADGLKYEAKDAYDSHNNIYFEVTGEGRMTVSVGDETVELKLKRAKYQ